MRLNESFMKYRLDVAAVTRQKFLEWQTQHSVAQD